LNRPDAADAFVAVDAADADADADAAAQKSKYHMFNSRKLLCPHATGAYMFSPRVIQTLCTSVSAGLLDALLYLINDACCYLQYQ
jgi:hypothetical protein